jgi:hypothetical protein
MLICLTCRHYIPESPVLLYGGLYHRSGGRAVVPPYSLLPLSHSATGHQKARQKQRANFAKFIPPIAFVMLFDAPPLHSHRDQYLTRSRLFKTAFRGGRGFTITITTSNRPKPASATISHHSPHRRYLGILERLSPDSAGYSASTSRLFARGLPRLALCSEINHQ